MARQLFGTDGVRGVAGEPPLDRATVSALGSALGKDLQEHGRDGAKPVVLIGMDTRESGLWIAEAVAGGLR
jgi:phosphoglucosamine mutase